MIVNFYDIESLINVFTLCNYKPNEHVIEVYYLIDDNETVGFDPQAHGKIIFLPPTKTIMAALNFMIYTMN